jgi:predicted transcriptional regulator
MSKPERSFKTKKNTKKLTSVTIELFDPDHEIYIKTTSGKVIPYEEYKVKPSTALRVTTGDHKSEDAIARALINNNGLVTQTARELELSHGAVSQRIKKSEYLQQMKKEAEEWQLDNAEDKLNSLVNSKNLGAICFTLKTKGKHRGFIEGTEVNHKHNVKGTVGVLVVPAIPQNTDDWSALAKENKRKAIDVTNKLIDKG